MDNPRPSKYIVRGDRPPSDRPVGARRPRGDPAQRIVSIASKDASAAAGPGKDKDSSSTASSSATTTTSSNITGFSSKTASEASAPSVAAAAPAAVRAPARAPVNVNFGLTDFKGSFSFDNFFGSLVGDLLPPTDSDGQSDAGAGSTYLTGISSGSQGQQEAPAGFPESEALLPRFGQCRKNLLELNKQVDKKLEQLRRDVAAQDAEHKETLSKLEVGVEGLFVSFGRLDQRISGVGQTAARIGDHLQSADAQRETASHIIDLIKYLMDFNRSREDLLQFSPPAAVFSDDKRMGEAASIARKLSALAEEDEESKEMVPGEGRKVGPSASPGLEVAVQNLQEYCNDLENKLLQKFDAAAQKKDLAGMAECARTLDQFQRGNLAYNRYVVTRPMFLDVEIMKADIRIATGETGSSIASVATSNPTRGLANLYKQIVETMKEESKVVAAVFPAPKAVMAILTQRVLEQRVQNVLDRLLLIPNIDSPEHPDELVNYLRTLSSAYEKTMDLATDLLKIGTGDLDVHAAAEGLFASHRDVYPDTEKTCLHRMFDDKYSAELHSSQHPASAPGGGAPGSGTGAAAAASLGGDAGVAGGAAAAAAAAAAGGALSASLVAECVRWNDEAVERCKVIVPEALPQVDVIMMLFQVLLDQVSTYTLVVLDRSHKGLAEAASLRDKFSIGTGFAPRVAQAAAAAAQQASVAGEQSIRSFFLAVKRATTNVATVHQYFASRISPLLMPVDGAHARCLEAVAQRMGDAEEMASRGLQSCMDASMGEVERLLQSEQKATEFRPSDDSLLPDHRPTNACSRVKAYVERIAEAAQSSLEGPNRRAFLLELGCRLHKALLAHIQRFTFNPGGGLRLKRDVSEYADFLRAFKEPTIDDRFESLSSLVNLFIVSPDSLRALVDSAGLSHSEALTYIALRDDYRSARIASHFMR